MTERKGERIGWTCGWIGGFLWVGILGAVFLAQSKVVAGGSGLLIFAVAVWAVLRLAPWRHPKTPYWRLFLRLYALFLLTILWTVWAFGGLGGEPLNGWMLLWMLPLFIPFVVSGRKTWADGEPGARQDK
jgi:hypothetical protein